MLYRLFRRLWHRPAVVWAAYCVGCGDRFECAAPRPSEEMPLLCGECAYEVEHYGRYLRLGEFV